MEIKPLDNTNFLSRNSNIRYADKLVRHVNNHYPRVSSTLVEDFANSSKYVNLINALIFDVIFTLRTAKFSIFHSAETLVDAAKAFIDPVVAYKRGNCAESAELAAIAAKVNGIKNTHIAQLFSQNGAKVFDQDHTVLIIEDETPYIIDAWLGFVDYVPETFLRYKKEFSSHFDIKEGDKLFLKKPLDSYAKFLDFDFDDDLVKEILEQYPMLKIK